MKAQHFLQVSSEIIGKHRHRSDVTRTTSTYLQICVASINNQLNAASYLLGHSEVETKSTVLNTVWIWQRWTRLAVPADVIIVDLIRELIRRRSHPRVKAIVPLSHRVCLRPSSWCSPSYQTATTEPDSRYLEQKRFISERTDYGSRSPSRSSRN